MMLINMMTIYMAGKLTGVMTTNTAATNVVTKTDVNETMTSLVYVVTSADHRVRSMPASTEVMTTERPSSTARAAEAENSTPVLMSHQSIILTTVVSTITTVDGVGSKKSMMSTAFGPDRPTVTPLSRTATSSPDDEGGSTAVSTGE